MRRLNVVYILPSRYDDEGYVHRYVWGVLPSNTLCCLRDLTRRMAESGELGPDVDVSVAVYDETVQRVPIQRIIRRGRKRGAELVVGLVGVQSNQFPRAGDLALEFRRQGVPVMIGGFHVSGVLALFDEPSAEMQRLMDAGVTLVRGEVDAPGALGGILRDALDGSLKPLYSITEAPDIGDAPVPQADTAYMKRFTGRMGTIDTSRGCPFNCSFCTIINVQGRKMRSRSVPAMLTSIEEGYERGVDDYFFTDDNLARSPVWGDLFEGLEKLRSKGKDIHFMMQVDTQAWRIPGFVERAARAGCAVAFIGMESINENNLKMMGKPQNKVAKYAEMVEAWHRAHVIVHVGYIIGMPHDTPESVRNDLLILKDRVKVDEASFFMLTPLPGSQDHKRMVDEGIPIDADTNNYDSFHETFRHPNMAPGQWRALYDEAWDTFYDKENVVNVLLRTSPERYWRMFFLALYNRHASLYRSHPMVTGFVRLKGRKSRRPTFPRESVLRHCRRRTKDWFQFAGVVLRLFFEYEEIWLLTRRKDDPRWSTLADLRGKWAEVRQRLEVKDLASGCEEAAGEVRAMLRHASERIADLDKSGRHIRQRVRRRLKGKAREIDNYLRSFEVQAPTWHGVKRAEQYISESLVAGYEELAISYVAKRRRFNAYRKDVIERLKSGRVLTLNVGAIPRVAFFEVMMGLRFLVVFLYSAFSRVGTT